ncbi:uncharacterized protein LOC131876746 [Cryptomeria japonica]|uniref:uncharacterized protein LOC131876746 n=1 Tax=Cryptomeria japonica TaxID=3369 RepID=UPI0027DAA05D|nr:uncharacterized protein LOC131876746 [Cryptomeria japonica]
MDFITGLLDVDGYSSIMVVVDSFSKYAIFVPCKAPCRAEDVADYFFRNVVKYWGVPLSQQPLTPHTVLSGYVGDCPDAKDRLKEWQDRVDHARHNLVKAVERMKHYADLGRSNVEFKVGDKVFLRMDLVQFKTPKGLSASLGRRFDGPFTIVGRIGKVAYKLKLPAHLRVHNVFHVSQLRLYHQDKEDNNRNIPTRGPTFVKDRSGLDVEEVIAIKE